MCEFARFTRFAYDAGNSIRRFVAVRLMAVTENRFLPRQRLRRRHRRELRYIARRIIYFLPGIGWPEIYLSTVPACKALDRNIVSFRKTSLWFVFMLLCFVPALRRWWICQGQVLDCGLSVVFVALYVSYDAVFLNEAIFVHPRMNYKPKQFFS